ncbi:MAG: M48 family metalloprotease [Candidatus Omnitrophica bacterium]|nr:M48 family metalloprotease [Candidatus Omnitrophota bacterium]
MKKVLFIAITAFLIASFSLVAWAFLFSISPEEEKALGRRIAKSIERRMPVYKDIEYEKRLMRIGYNLAGVSERKDIDYTFTIIDRDEINGFATFGGYIYIYKGAMDKTETDDELASIIAHEIGHVSAKHLTKRLEQDKAFSFGFALLDAFILRKQKRRKDIQRIVNISYDIIRRGYTKQDEYEADRLGTRYCYRAGYNPLAAITLLNKLKKEKRENGMLAIFENIDILRTHPYIDERIDTVLSEVAAIKAEEEFKKHDPAI